MISFEEFIDYLPDLVSFKGFIFYSIFAYIFSLTLSLCAAKFVQKNIDIEEGVKRNIRENREKELERIKLFRELKMNLAAAQASQTKEESKNN